MLPKEKSVTTVSLKMPETLAIQLEDTARLKGVSKSDLIRSALKAYLQSDVSGQRDSALSLAAEFAGVISGPQDLSANKDHMGNVGR